MIIGAFLFVGGIWIITNSGIILSPGQQVMYGIAFSTAFTQLLMKHEE